MNRRERLTRFIKPGERGIEIAPYFNPLVPRRLGYNCLSLDILDTETLRQAAAADPHVPRENLAYIEEVDLVGSATQIAELVAARFELGSFDYVISSHNLEHLPDFVRFLQGCEQVLRSGGQVAMALPDRRYCFDYFQPHTVTAEVLEAYFACRQRPTPAQVFRQESVRARYDDGQRQLISFTSEDNPGYVAPQETLTEHFRRWQTFVAQPDEVYRDVHCWFFTPASFELLLRDLEFLGLITLQIHEICGTNWSDIFVHLRKPERRAIPEPAGFYARRKQLLQCINDEATENSTRSFELKRVAQRVPELEAALAVQRQRSEELEAALASQRQRSAELEAAVESMRNSRSWRMTASLRMVSTLMRRMRGRRAA
jgi:SAM-dependent methyltransferase